MSRRHRLHAVLLCLGVLAQTGAPAAELLIRNAKVHSLGSAGTLDGADVLVRDGRVAAVGRGLKAAPDAEVVDAGGRPLTPGLFGGITGLGVEEVELEPSTVDRSVAYHRVLYWVKQKSFAPHKAEFYSLSDRLLKTARYENYQTMAGRARPTRLVMHDALRKGEESVLEYSGMVPRQLDDKIFTRDYLKRL